MWLSPLSQPLLELWQRHLGAHGGQPNYDTWFALAKAELGEVNARIFAHTVTGHGFHLTEDLVRVPLVIADGDRFAPGAIRSDLRSQRDLFATFLDLAGDSGRLAPFAATL